MLQTPEILVLRNPEDRKRFESLCSEGLMIFDELESQVSEMLKARFPKRKLKGEKLKQAVADFFEKTDKSTYGNWVYYPWSKRLVRVLPEEDFIFTRLSPNNPKIRPDEQARLNKKIVGVVGLSVGQSISLVLAMERICGELRIADFDVLELANLNRIRAGVHNMGLRKTDVVAREIWEIDPYFKIKTFEDGLTSENMDAFFHEGGDLDLIVDECDSVDIKIELRKKAKQMKMPVVMDMSDRGTIDIERFDLEPERPILHGWLEHLDYSNLGDLTNEEKVPFMMPIFGIDTISKRLKASMVEIGQTIHTWPQLATSVAMGGALAADTVRRIFLDQYEGSGRFHIDLDELITDGKPRIVPQAVKDYEWPELTEKEMRELAGQHFPAIKNETPLTREMAEKLVRLAGLAPSAGNNQPWKWLYQDGSLFLFHDKERSYSWTDHDDRMAMISLGTAQEALVLAASREGLKADVLDVKPDAHPLISAFSFRKAAVHDELEKGLEVRCANRKWGQDIPLDPNARNAIIKSIEPINGVELQLFEEKETIEYLADIVARAERIRYLNPQGHYEFYGQELRWTPEEVKATKDGLDIETLELKPSDITGLEVASDPYVIALLNEWKAGRNLEKMTREACEHSSALALLTVDDLQIKTILNGGRAVMRLWIEANLAGWSVHPVSAPLFFANRIELPNHKLMEHEVREITDLKQELITLVPDLSQRKGLFLCRLSKGGKPTRVALRRETKEILV